MKEHVRERLTGLTEAELRKDVIIPILERTPNLKQITDVHGANEKGLDVIFFSEDHIRKTCYGMQLKRGDISGGGSRTETVSQIIDQLNLASEFKHPVAIQPTGEYRIERFIVATNGRISTAAQDEIASRVNPIDVDFWDLSEVLRRANDVYPEILQAAADSEAIEYLKYVEAKCETLDSLDQLTGIAKRTLSDVFVEPAVRRRFDPTLADSKGGTTTPHTHTVNALSIPEDGGSSVVLIGEQNEGKTAILRMMAIERVQSVLNGDTDISAQAQIPVLIRARNVLQHGDLTAAVADALEQGGAVERAEALAEGADLTPYLLLVDGFSEVTSEKEKKKVAQVLESADSSATLMVAARPDDFLRPGFFDEFDHYTIKDFDQPQVRQLIQKWTSNTAVIEDVAEKMVDRVRDALQLPGSPIPAIIGVMLYEKEHRYITNTAEAVDRYMVIRLGRYSEEMGVRMEVEWQRKQDLLAEVAFNMVEEGLDQIAYDRAVAIMDEFYDRIGEPRQSKIAIGELITTGVLESVGTQYLAFFRLGFRDFFAAKKIVSQHGSVPEFFRRRIFDRRWGQALVFAAGLRRHNSDVLNDLNQLVSTERDQLNVGQTEDYLYGAYLLGRVLSNSDAAEKAPRLEVLHTAVQAACESASMLAKEAEEQFGPIGEVVALVGTEQTLLVTVGVPWLAEQYLELFTDPELEEEERYLLASVYSHLACDDWMQVLETAIAEAKSPRVVAALLMLVHVLDTQRTFTGEDKKEWKNLQKSLQRKQKRFGKTVDRLLEVRDPLLKIERQRLRRLKGKNP